MASLPRCNEPMNKRKKSGRPLAAWQTEDAARLRVIWHRMKGDLQETQEAFSERVGLGTQGAFSQFINGVTALNLDAALKIARGLRVSVADFSPTLADRMSFECGVRSGSYDDDDVRLIQAWRETKDPAKRSAITILLGINDPSNDPSPAPSGSSGKIETYARIASNTDDRGSVDGAIAPHRKDRLHKGH